MFDYLVSDNSLEPVMEEHGLVLPEDLIFIKEQIAGPQGTKGPLNQVLLMSHTFTTWSNQNANAVQEQMFNLKKVEASRQGFLILYAFNSKSVAQSLGN